jgi:hypothetical protein
MEKIKIKFADFWGGFNYNPNLSNVGDNVFYDMLSERFEVEISDTPDILIYSVFGNTNQNIKYCKRVFYTGENIRPNFNNCDYAISFDYIDDPRNHRLPLSGITLYENNIKKHFPKSKSPSIIKSEKNKFCNFVFSNQNANHRNQLFSKLNSYKMIDAGGRVFNNLGFLVSNKIEFLKSYKFTICFENSEYPGYTTEKLIHPKLVDSIPIYWGNPDVAKDFNTKAFINAYDLKDLDELVSFIIEVDKNDNLYFDMLNETHFKDDKIPFDLDYNNLLDFFENIIHQ